jgi:hypothetical protein
VERRTRYIDRALQLDANLGEAHVARASMLENARDLNGAEQAYQQRRAPCRNWKLPVPYLSMRPSAVRPPGIPMRTFSCRSVHRHSLLPLAGCLAAALAIAPATADAQRPLEHYDAWRNIWIRSGLLPGLHARASVRHAGPAKARAGRVRPVDNCNDSGPGSLRDAVAEAASGDTVDLSQLRCSTITLTGGAIVAVIDDLRLRGRARNPTTIDGNLADRVIYHAGSGTLALSGLTIAHGRATADQAVYGGCVFSYGSVALDHATVTGCSVESAHGKAYGGGVFAYRHLSAAYSTLTANHAQGVLPAIGGAFFAYRSATLAHATVSGNSSAAQSQGYGCDASGGGIFVIGDLDMSDSAISGNTVTATSSDIYYGSATTTANEAGGFVTGTARVSRSTINGNVAQAINTAADAYYSALVGSYGGGLRANSLDVVASTISGNSTAAVATNPLGLGIEVSRGGGLTTWGPYGTVSLVNSTVSGNASSRSNSAAATYGFAGGGGIFTSGDALVLRNSTVAFNTAEFAGGVYQYSLADIRLDSTIVAGNAGGGGGFSGNAGADLGTYMVQAIGGANSLVVDANLNAQLPGDTLSADPQLGPLADNGGPTPTHALSFGSPAIDGGNNVAGLKFDQRGNGHPRLSGAATDIGAFERVQ